MSKTIVQESNLEFTFSSEWYIKKYDTHPFYLSISGEGLRAVDFIGIHPNGDWWLMEVKNYRNRRNTEQIRIDKNMEGDMPILFQTVQQKILDTQAGVQAIGTYLERKWWYRWRYYLLNRFGWQKKLLQKDRMFWMKLSELMVEQSTKGKTFLWLELPDRFMTAASVSQRAVQIDNKFDIVHRKQLPYFVEQVVLLK